MFIILNLFKIYKKSLVQIKMEVKSTECSNNIKMNSNFNNDILEDESKLPKLSHRKRLRTKSTRIDLKNRVGLFLTYAF